MFTDSPIRRRVSPKKHRRGLSFRRLFRLEMADQEEDFSQLPLPDRFTHKNWKVRKEGYEAAVKAFEATADESDPVFAPFIQDPGLWKGAAGDSNVAAQQEGLGALCAFLRLGGQHAASRTRGQTIAPIYEKGLASTRPAVKANSLEALMLYVELDKPDVVIEELLPGLLHKTPKVIAATTNAITALFHNYGCKTLDPKPVLKALPKAFGHADKNVRAEATSLTVELYRWLKDAIKAIFWNDLKPVQQQDLEKLFEKVKEEPAPKQERFTRAQQAAMATAADAGKSAGHAGGDAEDGGADAEEPAEIDAFDLAEPIDVLSKVPKDFQENMASTKWKERKDALDALLEILNTPRIKEGPFDDIIRTLAKCMKDANIAVVISAANCVEKLANGLRRSFARYRSIIMSPIMERLKEKKQSVADALGAALDAIFASTSLSECLDEILGFLTNKNPQIKLESTRFLIRCLKNTKDVPSKAEVKSIADAATKVLTDTQEVTRSAGAEVLGTLMKIMGERAMGPHLEGLDDIRKNKIKEYFETAEVKAKDRPKPIVGPPKAAPASALGKKVAPGKKPTAVKKPAPVSAAPPPPPPVDDPTPLHPKPTAKSLPKSGGLPKPGSGLKAPLGLKRPGSIAGGVASPSRRVISPPTATEEETPASPSVPPPRVGLGRGGLTGRSLGKPSFSATNVESTPAPAMSSGLSAIEKAELEELRLEKDRLTKLTDDLRSTNTKLTAEVSELQNQNAQLIEDHTRDVLQIKAKETQLVRARGENDVLRQEIETVRKDSERLKREVGRLGRESLGRERESLLASQERDGTNGNIYEDTKGMPAIPPSTSGGSNSAATRPLHRPQSINTTTSTSSTGRPRSFILSPSEEKENTGELSSTGRRKISPPYANGGSNYSSGRASPQRPGIGSRLATGASTASNDAGSDRVTSAGSTTSGNGGEPAENWKRAAEVTSQLKARIEQMKVCPVPYS